MLKVAIFQSDLSVGGIQKSLINFLNVIDYSLVSVDLFLYQKDAFFHSQLPDDVRVSYLSKLPKISKILSFNLVSKLFRRPKLGEYDISIDYNGYWHECALDALNVQSKRKIMWLHNDVEKKAHENWRFRLMWSLYQGKLRKFDEFVAVSVGVKDAFIRKYKRSCNVAVIPNRINFEEIHIKKDEVINLDIDPAKINIVSAGRLHHQKGFDILIQYFHQASRLNPLLRLYILGEGSERRKLQRMIDNFELGDKVFLAGSFKNPYAVFNRMDAFVLTSRYEGQGIVLIEALALGLPILMEKHLEKYNENILGVENLVSAMANCSKKPKISSDMSQYDKIVLEKVTNLLELS